MIGGGFKAIWYSLRASKDVGIRNMVRAMKSKNTCKTCALGMGGQKGGMTDEEGSFPEVCKKSFQAQITDIQDGIPAALFSEKSIGEFRNMPARSLERSGRLNTPLYKAKGDSHYVPVSWNGALDKIIRRFKETPPERSFFYASGRSSNEASFVLQLFARIYGCNHVNSCSYYCHQASGVAMSATLGTGTATVQLDDLRHADLIFVAGANPSSNHPRFVRQLINCRRRGGHVIVINPAREKGLVKFAIPSDVRSMVKGGDEVASVYLQPHIGGDIALFKGIAKAVIEDSRHDLSFMKAHTRAYEAYMADIEQASWEAITTHSGIAEREIREVAAIYGKAKNAVFAWAMGLTHHVHGVNNVESLASLALLRGMVGRPFAGLLPLRGHSNVQGVGSVGVTPALKDKVFENIERHFSIRLPRSAGMDTMSCMNAAHRGEIDLAFVLGGNLYNANPDAVFAEGALDAIPFKVFLNTTLNHGHFYGVSNEALILPVAARDEETQKTTQESMFNFVRISDGGLVRLDNVRSETEIICDVAHGVLGASPVDFKAFRTHRNVRKAIAETIPGFEKLGTIDDTLEEFQIGGRTLHRARFATPDQKAVFRVCDLPDTGRHDGELRMMSVRSEGQFNSVVYEEADLYRGQTSRWVVLMNPQDIHSRGLRENDMVNLQSATGTMERVAVREFDIPPGNAMTYYPESNMLISKRTDEQSHTPGFKLTWIKVIPIES